MVIRAVVWKELREQGLIGLTLLVMGGGVLAAAAAFADPPTSLASPSDVIRYLGLGRLATLMLAVTAGVVSGGALFAAERESGTMGFLESLPVSRWRIWQAKLLAGFLLAVLQIAGLLILASSLDLLGGRAWTLFVASYSFMAFAWGAFGSTLARTTLGSVGVALPFAMLASLCYLLLILLLFRNPGTYYPRQEGNVLYFFLMIATPIAASAVVFTRRDRLQLSDDLIPRVIKPESATARRKLDSASPPVTSTAERQRFGWTALLWLAGRQLRLPILVASAFALFFGVSLLMPSMSPFLVWPPLALCAGMLAGVLTFADEQGKGVARFWAERRLPVGRLWAVKVGAHLLFAFWLVGLLALPSIVRAQLLPAEGLYRTPSFLGTAFREKLFDELHGQSWVYLFAPVFYGFVPGILCGLFFRKAVVAAGVAGMVGGTLLLLWLPSMLGGGLSAWQVAAPIAVLLAVSRTAVGPWSADRLLTRRPVRVVAAGFAVAVVALVVGIGYRVLEVPDTQATADDVAYVDSLPSVEVNIGGREYRTAAERLLQVLSRRGIADRPKSGNEALDNSVNLPLSPDPYNKLGGLFQQAFLQGWPADGDAVRIETDKTLDPLFERRRRDQTWYESAATAAAEPVGVYEDPRRITAKALKPSLETARVMGQVLLLRALQDQARGDPAAFRQVLQTTLTLVKTLRTGSVSDAFRAGNAVERSAQLATDRWLERLPGRSDQLLREVLVLWQSLDAGPPFDPVPYYLAERYLIRLKADSPSQWLPELLTFNPLDKDLVSPQVDVVAVAWTVPWERERARRLLGLKYEEGAGDDNYALVRDRPGAAYFRPQIPTPDRLTESARRLEVGRRLTILKLALRLYEEAEGKTAESLDQLVPKYLPALPVDPYAAGQSFHYRVSKGETLEVLPNRGGGDEGPQSVAVPPGQGIIWSVGPERRFAEGRRIAPRTSPARLTAVDFVTLTPLRPKGGA